MSESDKMRNTESSASSVDQMRMLGLVGGTSWSATVAYYSQINQLVNEHFGDNTNPPLVVYNVNQSLVHGRQRAGDWEGVADLFDNAAITLQAAGAEGVIFYVNTPHKIYDTVQAQLKAPILHIADASAQAIRERGLSRVSFIGTKFSMTEDFIVSPLAQQSVEVLPPEETTNIDALHRIIQEELTFNRLEDSSKQFVLDELNAMMARGAKGLVLGCTEFPLMITPEDLDVPVFDTAEIHAQAAVNFILRTEDE